MSIELLHRAHQLCALIPDDKCVIDVVPRWSAPLSRPDKFLALLDPKGKEVALLVEPRAELSAESWRALELELRRRNLTARIESIVSAHEDNGAIYWSVATNRGQRDFVMTNPSTSANWFGETRLLLLDAQENRYEIEDTQSLDERSRALLEGVL